MYITQVIFTLVTGIKIYLLMVPIFLKMGKVLKELLRLGSKGQVFIDTLMEMCTKACGKMTLKMGKVL